jgi:hypothetical protein
MVYVRLLDVSLAIRKVDESFLSAIFESQQDVSNVAMCARCRPPPSHSKRLTGKKVYLAERKFTTTNDLDH